MWFVRWEQASERERRSLFWFDRSSRPKSCPRVVSMVEQERICAERRRTGWRPRLIAGAALYCCEVRRQAVLVEVEQQVDVVLVAERHQLVHLGQACRIPVVHTSPVGGTGS